MFFSPLKKIRLLAMLFFAIASTTYCITPDKQNLVILEESVKRSFFDDYFHLKLDSQLDNVNIQSLAHYNHPGLQENCINTDTIKQKIHELGKEVISKTINKAIRKEVELSGSHYVFYHGCKLDFLLFQDILKLLAETKAKKMVDDFFLLRIPTTLSKTYSSVDKFLKPYATSEVNDSLEPARSLLLSVNPSLFGNTVSRETSSAFCYFLSSTTAFAINSLSLISKIFDHYSLATLYKKYETELNDLSQTLTAHEDAKTGLLMQIFIPKNKVDQLTYRSKPRGVPYYGPSDIYAQTPSVELDAYQKHLFSTLFSKKSFSYADIDTLQYRILLNTEMLTPANKTPATSIKIHRYLNKTPKVREYKTKLALLSKKITQDMKKMPV